MLTEDKGEAPSLEGLQHMIISADKSGPAGVNGASPSQEASRATSPLQSASQSYQQLFQGLPVACFCFDLYGRITEWNEVGDHLFQWGEGTVLRKPVWEVVGCRDDEEIMQALVRGVLNDVSFSNIEWEDVGPDGERRHFLSNIFPLRNGASLIGGISASIDISARKQAELALWESEERRQLAIRGSNDGLWDWNIRTGASFYSPRWKQMLGFEAEEDQVTRENWERRLHPDDAALVQTALQDHLDQKTEFYHAEYRLQCRDGGYRWFLDRGQALWDRSGRPLRIAGSLTDITERKSNERELQEANLRLHALATEDGLTGLKNHRAFQERLATEYGLAPRHDFPLSVCLIDVDQFKQYNDTFGHPAGDQVLMRVAALLSGCARETDFVARYGGEEFVLLLPHTDRAGALAVAERCRMAVRTEPWADRPITISLGISTLTPATRSQADLVDAADRALYAAKAGGRNRSICSGNAV